MKNGDLVSVIWKSKVTRRVLCVALNVTKKDIMKMTNVTRPGIYLFRGYWYGKNPLDINSYGKIEGKHGKVIGKIKSHKQACILKI